MEPLLTKRTTPLKRNLLFVPIILLTTFIVFLTIGLSTHSMVAALYISPFFGVAAAWLLVGWPVLSKPGHEEKPMVSKRTKPFLFFPLFIIFAVVLYPILGLMLTSVVDPRFMAYVAIAIAVLAGGGLAYLFVGFPPLVREARTAWKRIPPATKPWLSLPGGALLSILLYVPIGIGLTQAPVPLEFAIIGAIVLSLILGFTSAILLFGFPKPKRRVNELVPKVPATMRPLAFGFVLLALTPLFAIALGPWISDIPGLPPTADLYIALLVALILAFAVAAFTIGLPHTWRRLADYRGGVPDHVRLALFLPTWAIFGAILTVVATFTGLGIPLALLVGVLVGVIPALFASGAWRKLKEPERAAAVWEIPDKVKPALFITAWIVLSLVFFALTRVLYATFRVNLILGVILGLLGAIVLVELPLIRTWNTERRESRELRKRLHKERATRLGTARSAIDARASAAAADEGTAARPGFLSRFKRK